MDRMPYECHAFRLVNHTDLFTGGWTHSIAVVPGKINLYVIDRGLDCNFDFANKLNLKFAYEDHQTVFYATNLITAWYWRLKWKLYKLWSVWLVKTYIKLEDINLICHPVEPGMKIHFSDLL